jgi:hypothetical protein
MPRTPAQYRLVIFDSVDDPQELREAAARATGLNPTDAVQWLARAPGTWPQPLEETQTRAFLDVLYEAQIAAEAWRTDQFPELSPVRTVHRVACLDAGLRIEGLRAEPTHWAPWDRIELICAGRISAEEELRQAHGARSPSPVVSGVRALALMKPRPASRSSRAQRVARDPVGEVVIVRRDPRVAFRAVENQMSYAYLGERLSTSAAENFPVFLSDLCVRSTEAFVTPSTHALMENRQDGEADFPSSQALLEYATHRLLWSWYRLDRDAQARADDSTAGDDDFDRPAGTEDDVGDDPAAP